MTATTRKVHVRQSGKAVYVRITITFVLSHCHKFQPNWIVAVVVIVSSSVDNSGPKHVAVVLKCYFIAVIEIIIIIIIIIIALDRFICITNYETQWNTFCQD